MESTSSGQITEKTLFKLSDTIEIRTDDPWGGFDSSILDPLTPMASGLLVQIVCVTSWELAAWTLVDLMTGTPYGDNPPGLAEAFLELVDTGLLVELS